MLAALCQEHYTDSETNQQLAATRWDDAHSLHGETNNSQCHVETRRHQQLPSLLADATRMLKLRIQICVECRHCHVAATAVELSRTCVVPVDRMLLVLFLIVHLRSYRTVSWRRWIFKEQNTEWDILWRRLWMISPCVLVP